MIRLDLDGRVLSFNPLDDEIYEALRPNRFICLKFDVVRQQFYGPFRHSAHRIPIVYDL